MLKKSISKNIIWMAIAILFISVFAQITINLPTNSGNIPITGQTFAVLLVGYILGKKRGTFSVLLYIILGTLGLPIFADGESGFEVIRGGSGGYLLGFLVGTFTVGYFSELDWTRSFPKSLIAMTIGTLIIMLFGVLRLAQLYDFDKAMEWGFYPFIIGGIIKIILGAAILPIYYHLKN